MGNGDGVTDHSTPVAITSSEKFISVDSGVYRSCGVTDSHQILCWGNNQYGEIGNGLETGDVHTPTAINSAEKFRSVSLGSWHSCALTLDGRAFCWGRGEDNRLGNGSLANQPSPVAVKTTLRFRSLVGGSAHTCGITSDGKAYCWGLNTSGQLGAGSAMTNEPFPVAVASTRTVKHISTTDSTTCMVTTRGETWCWGPDASGQLGNGAATTATQKSPVLVDMTNVTGSAKVFTQLVAGAGFSCGLTSKGYAACWGDNDHGQVGNNGASATNFATPQELETDRRFLTLTAGTDHACGLTGEGKAYCWGRNAMGQLGTGSTVAQSIPTAVATQESFTAISAGGHMTCGVTIKGTVHCWGSDASGELGNGAVSGNQLTPGLVDASGLFRSIAVGLSHACAIHSSGQAYCWGANSSGQLGDGTTAARPSPVLSNAATRFMVVAAGSGFTCALKATGEGVCWGSDDHGRLGNDAIVGDQLTASAVSPAGVFKTLSAGQDHACAIDHAGAPSCWGDDSFGQVGNDGAFDASTIAAAPVATAGKVYIQIAAGGSHTCGLTATGDAFCWGSDTSEQLGDGAGATNLAAPGASAIAL